MEKQRYFKTRRAADTRVDVLFLENKTKVYPPWKKKRREKEQHGQSATLPCPPLEPLANAGDGYWFVVRENYCCLAGGWRLLLEWCERKILLAGAGAEQQNIVSSCDLKRPQQGQVCIYI
jgi:hypothetical protein